MARRIDADGRELGLTRQGPTSVEELHAIRAKAATLAIIHSTALIRRDLLLAVRGYPDDYFMAADMALFNLRLAPLTDIVAIDRPLAFRRVHTGQISRRYADLIVEADEVIELNVRRIAAGETALGYREALRVLDGGSAWQRIDRLRRHRRFLWQQRGIAELSDGSRAAGALLLLGTLIISPFWTLDRARRIFRERHVSLEPERAAMSPGVTHSSTRKRRRSASDRPVLPSPPVDLRRYHSRPLAPSMSLESPVSINRLTRDHDNALLGGVCAGLATRYDLDLTLLRVCVVVLALVSFGLVPVAYLAAWVLMPLPDATERPASEIARANVDEVVGTARRAAVAVAHTNREEIRETSKRAAREVTHAARYATDAARSTLQRDVARRRDHRPSEAAPPTPPGAAPEASATPSAAPPYPTVPVTPEPPMPPSTSADPASMAGVAGAAGTIIEEPPGAEAPVAPSAEERVAEDLAAAASERTEAEDQTLESAPPEPPASDDAETESEPSTSEAPEDTRAVTEPVPPPPVGQVTESTESRPWVPPPPPPRAEPDNRPRASHGGGFMPPGAKPAPPPSGPRTPPGAGGPRLP